MKVFVWEYVDSVSNNYHSEGGLLVVAKDEDRARELIENHPHACVTDDEWRDVIIINAEEGEQERIIAFPDAGCC